MKAAVAYMGVVKIRAVLNMDKIKNVQPQLLKMTIMWLKFIVVFVLFLKTVFLQF